MRLKTLPIFLAFLVMGVADAMGPMSKAAKEAYNISDFMAKLLPFFVFIAFAALSVPGGLLAARIGKKKLLLMGVVLNTIAVAVPSFIVPNFQLLLACIFLLGVGTTFLQVAGNPIMRDVSAAGAYSRNLAFAQGIKGIGSFGSTALLALVAAIPFLAARQWRGAFPVYLVLMVLTFISVAALKIEEAKADMPPGIGSSLGLLKEPVFALAVLGIFLYVGAEVCMTSSLESGMNAVGIRDKWGNYLGPTAFLVALTIGRLVAGSVNVSARAFFRLSAALGLAGILLILTGNKVLTVGGAILGGLGFANIWPMLFAITVEEKPERASELSGLMCMAISGGALVPLVMGKLVDLKMGALAFIVPAVCFAYLLLLSLKSGGKAGPTAETSPSAAQV
jgi:fucose permease